MNILEEIQNCPVEWKELGEVVEVLDSLRRPTTKSQRIQVKFLIMELMEFKIMSKIGFWRYFYFNGEKMEV